MASNPRYSNGSRRRKLRERLKAERRPCHICGDYIDYTLPAGHPDSFEVDEIVPVSKGGSPYEYENVDAAHRKCNQRRGNKPVPIRTLSPKEIDEIEKKKEQRRNSRRW